MRKQVDTAVLKQISVPRVYSVIVDQVQDLIRSGVLAPGDKLPTERALAEQLGVSRSSVREALSALEVLGMIRSRPGLGNYVAEDLSSEAARHAFESLISEGGTVEILEARRIFEPDLAALAAQRRGEDDLTSMQSCLMAMEARLAAGQDAWEPDWGFHAAVAAAGQNPVVVAIIDLLGQRMTGELWQLMRERNLASTSSRPHEYLEDHRAIYLAIEHRKPLEATNRMRQHLETIAQHLADSDRDHLNPAAELSDTYAGQ